MLVVQECSRGVYNKVNVLTTFGNYLLSPLSRLNSQVPMPPLRLEMKAAAVCDSIMKSVWNKDIHRLAMLSSSPEEENFDKLRFVVKIWVDVRQ